MNISGPIEPGQRFRLLTSGAGSPFSALLVLWVNFLVTVPVALAVGFDEPASDLMVHKLRPLKQPILSCSQWMRFILIGLLTAIVTALLSAFTQLYFGHDSASCHPYLGETRS